jgi:hypothetical protein
MAPGERRERLVRFPVPLGFGRLTLRNEATVNYRQAAATTSHTIEDPEVEVTKRLDRPAAGVFEAPGQPPLLLAGASVDYTVTVTNRGAGATAGMTLTDAPMVERRAADGTVTATALATQLLNVPALQPTQSTSFIVSVAVPPGTHGATLVNRVLPSLAGLGVIATEHAIVEPTSAGGLLVTEMVVDPQQDWNDTVGGNAVPFDASPGTGAVDAGDIWVEITRPTTATTNWKVVLTDALGETVEQTFGEPPTDPSALVKVLGGFDAITQPVVKVEVIDDGGIVRQMIDVAALKAQYPLITGPADEALFWSVYGLPSLVIQQFVQGSATPGLFRPF